MPPKTALVACALGHSGRELPGEIVNMIFNLVLQYDNRAIVLPGSTAVINIPRPQLKRKGGGRVKFAITSICPLMRTWQSKGPAILIRILLLTTQSRAGGAGGRDDQRYGFQASWCAGAGVHQVSE